ncbi:MAG: glucose-6-phosphate isomerase [Betaproteobacteria bacterium]|nr:glucose-6-phosphate isomerase [Betaproteobacteria bacterium]
MSSTLTSLPAWQALLEHQRTSSFDLRELFEADPRRFDRHRIAQGELLLDYSKHYVTGETMRLLVALADARDLRDWTRRLMSGERINVTENRPALHTALRANRAVMLDGRDVTQDVVRVRAQMRRFSDALRTGAIKGATGRAFTDVINIGIGGSDLGPALAVEALAPYAAAPRVHFMSNVDGAHVEAVIKGLDPETTLAIVASKTFGTQETLTNANTVRAWLAKAVGTRTGEHFSAVTANVKAAHGFGISDERIFEFWDWVGGRYSLWSAVGLPIAIAVGMDAFEAMCDGARGMDEHFASAPFERNMPVVMALLGVWYGDFFNRGAHAVLPYDMRLERFPDYLQQLEMESNGKRVTREGVVVDYDTCPVVWGAPGTNGQHAFYQMLHQGTGIVPADFLVCCKPHHALPEHHAILLANCYAQTEALMRGRTPEEARAEMSAQGLPSAEVERLLPHKVFPGNRPTSTLVLDALTPRALGALIALYEHKVFTQSVIWGVNAFDQWGVELGKKLADRILPELSADAAASSHDSSTNGLIDYTKSKRRLEQP